VELIKIKRTDPRLLDNMFWHYSQPDGFVGRNICYAITHDGRYYGGIVGGSSTLHLVGRDAFFDINQENKRTALRGIINNIFYHIEPINGKYPYRNFTISVVREFRIKVAADWTAKYGDQVLGFESLVELPRTGEIYKRDGWTEVGITKGQTCKRVAGKGTDSWSGKRVWDVNNLRPKRVFCRMADPKICAGFQPTIGVPETGEIAKEILGLKEAVNGKIGAEETECAMSWYPDHECGENCIQVFTDKL
jgi:hypothetical protein